MSLTGPPSRPAVPPPGPGAFPLGDPALHLATVPYPRAVGMRWLGMGERSARLGLALRRPVARREQSHDPGVLLGVPPPARPAAIDPRVVLGLIDHCCSSAIYATMTANAPIATLDLRIELIAAPPPGADLVCEARCPSLAGGIAFAEAVVHAGATSIARGNATFVVGAYPGQPSITRPDGRWAAHVGRDPGDPDAWPHYDALLGAQAGESGVALPFADHLVGAVSLPALHGGVVAALLATAATHAMDGALAADPPRSRGVTAALPAPRLATLSVQYLRAAQSVTTVAEARIEKRGSASDFVSVRASQEDGSRVVALAQALFVRG